MIEFTLTLSPFPDWEETHNSFTHVILTNTLVCIYNRVLVLFRLCRDRHTLNSVSQNEWVFKDKNYNNPTHHPKTKTSKTAIGLTPVVSTVEQWDTYLAHLPQMTTAQLYATFLQEKESGEADQFLENLKMTLRRSLASPDRFVPRWSRTSPKVA